MSDRVKTKHKCLNSIDLSIKLIDKEREKLKEIEDYVHDRATKLYNRRRKYKKLQKAVKNDDGEAVNKIQKELNTSPQLQV